MKAVVLAGGRGERLRPITDTRPKPLVPVLARPVMDYILSLLAHHGYDKAYLTTHYLAEQIRSRYGSSAFGLSLAYSEEKEPLGTAGGVKLLEKELKDEEFFLVIAGDSICDFDLTRAAAFHREKGADVTIVLSSVKTPLEYGVVLADSLERIFAFSEKPDWSETFSDLVNTGTYLVSPRVLKEIPQGKKFDFAKDLFPDLLQRGFSLFGYKAEGYWCDIGKISTLYRCNYDMLSGKAKTYFPREGRKVLSSEGYHFISDGASVEEGAVLYQNNILSPRAKIAKNAQLSDSVIMEDAKIGEGAVVKGAIVCENATLSSQSVVLPGSVIGAGARLEKGACLPENARVAPREVIPAAAGFSSQEIAFTEGGTFFGEEGLEEERVMELAARSAAFFKGKIGVVARAGDAAARRFAALFESGAVAAGGEVLSFGEGSGAMASFAAMQFACPCFFVESRCGKAYFFGFEKDSLPFLRETTISLSREGKKQEKEGFLWQVADLEEQYIEALSQEIGKKKTGAVSIRPSFHACLLEKAAIKSGVRAYHGTREDDVHLEVFEGGMKLFSRGVRLLDTERAKLFALLGQQESGKKQFYIPTKESPFLCRELEKRGAVLHRFSLSHTAKEENEARQEAGREARLFWDSAFLAAQVLNGLDLVHVDKIREKIRNVPVWFQTSLFYLPQEENRAGMIRTALSFENENVRILPGYFGIKILSEATKFEAALDQAFEIRGKLNEIEKGIGGK